MTQPEALRLACALIERHGVESFQGDAAAELRRLSAVEAQRDALLEVAKLALRMGQYGGVSPRTVEDAARAAIKQVEEGQ